MEFNYFAVSKPRGSNLFFFFCTYYTKVAYILMALLGIPIYRNALSLPKEKHLPRQCKSFHCSIYCANWRMCWLRLHYYSPIYRYIQYQYLSKYQYQIPSKYFHNFLAYFFYKQRNTFYSLISENKPQNNWKFIIWSFLNSARLCVCVFVYKTFMRLKSWWGLSNFNSTCRTHTHTHTQGLTPES